MIDSKDDGICKCSVCGFEWLRGHDGSHSCIDGLKKENQKLKGEIERTNKKGFRVRYSPNIQYCETFEDAKRNKFFGMGFPIEVLGYDGNWYEVL